MADERITIPDLGSLTSGQASDLLLATRGTTGYKMLLSDLAKYMVETYNSSSLAGSAQSVKNALDSLNSRMGTFEIIQDNFSSSAIDESFTLENGLYLIVVDRVNASSAQFTAVYISYIHNASHVSAVLNSESASVSISGDKTINIQTTYSNTAYRIYRI